VFRFGRGPCIDTTYQMERCLVCTDHAVIFIFGDGEVSQFLAGLTALAFPAKRALLPAFLFELQDQTREGSLAALDG
jgi:hypothetical protein